jgi:hypothetical protein
MIFYIFCDLTNDSPNIGDIMDGDLKNNFLQYYGIDNKNAYEITLLMQYYMFTSLSTVGFGDLAPRSDLERVFITVTILFGELIF